MSLNISRSCSSSIDSSLSERSSISDGENDSIKSNFFENNYEVQEKIGEGSGAIVRKCNLKGKPDKVYACKIFRTDDDETK